MSVRELASTNFKFPYEKLKHDGELENEYEREKVLLMRSRSNFCRFRLFRRVSIRKKRFRLKVPSLKKFLIRRVVSAVRVSCAKVLKRFKEGEPYFGELFAGNYLFVQVNPPSLKSLKKRHDLVHSG